MFPVCSLKDLEIYQPDERSYDFSRRLGCSGLVSAFLARGERAEEEVRELLEPRPLRRGVLDVFLGGAAERLGDVWRSSVPGKNVFVWGDYDVDGVSSTVLALELAQEWGAASAVYYIPDRRSEGYGVDVERVRSVVADGFDTLIVVDCGSKDVEAVELAKGAGMNVMIFDHHAAEGEIVRLPSLLNPQIDGDEGARSLCATALLWCWAAQSDVLPGCRRGDLLQLAALATVSDCMPLSGLNRAIVREGIGLMRDRPRRGLRELFRTLCPGEPVWMMDEQRLAMKVIPCLNAAGRLEVADVAVNVLSGGGDEGELEGCVARLVELNRRRRDISTAICASVNERMESNGSQVLFDGRWPVGILSAVASRLTSEHNRAFALASPSGRRIRGTLRVPEGANAVELLGGLDDLLEAWGGHKSAAGFSVSHVKWQRFARELDSRLKNITVAHRLLDVIEMEPEKITRAAWEDLLRLGPFGNGNPSPLFYVAAPSADFRPGEALNVAFAHFGRCGQHVKVFCGGVSLLAFNAGSQIENMRGIRGWLYRPRQNYWQGRVSLQYVVERIVAD